MLANPQLISARTISKEIGVSPVTAFKMLKRGVFGSVVTLSEGRSRTHYRVRRSDFDFWIHRNGFDQNLFESSA